jgi:precorrin-6Y C5,15-methyltransferase (decarboxylating)
LIKKPWQQAKIISLHGRPLRNLIPYLANHCLIAVLTDQYSHPQAIANLLCQYGCEQSTLWICQALGTDQQKISTAIAKQLTISTQSFHPLHITIIETNSIKSSLTSFPGFKDELFITDSNIAGKGMISKREVRLATLSLLQPKANQIAWDIGAGCGTIAVEWAYWNQQGSLYAVEHHPKRLICLEKNKYKFGVNNLHIIADKAPQGLDNLPQPHAIFIGGSAGKLNLIMDVCWKRLITKGCIVINCVTEPCKIELQQWLQRHNIADNALEWTEIAISKGDQLAGQLLMRPRLPVRLLKIVKG